jgi:hypothetical protein
MSSRSGPLQPASHHRGTLRQLPQHPVRHNIQRRGVVWLLKAAGSMVEHHDGTPSLPGRRPHSPALQRAQGIGTHAVVDLRRMPSAAGYRGRGPGQEDWPWQRCPGGSAGRYRMPDRDSPAPGPGLPC